MMMSLTIMSIMLCVLRVIFGFFAFSTLPSVTRCRKSKPGWGWLSYHKRQVQVSIIEWMLLLCSVGESYCLCCFHHRSIQVEKCEASSPLPSHLFNASAQCKTFDAQLCYGLNMSDGKSSVSMGFKSLWKLKTASHLCSALNPVDTSIPHLTYIFKFLY